MTRIGNLDLAHKVFAQVTKHPETHNQAEWGQKASCGTAGCLAGWACVISGDEPVWHTTVGAGDPYFVRVRDSAGVEHLVRDRGEALLGLSKSDAELLFLNPSNEAAVDMLWSWIEESAPVEVMA